MKGISVWKKTDEKIEGVENSQSMSLKGARVWVVDSDTMKQFPGFGMNLQ